MLEAMSPSGLLVSLVLGIWGQARQRGHLEVEWEVNNEDRHAQPRVSLYLGDGQGLSDLPSHHNMQNSGSDFRALKNHRKSLLNVHIPS